jgi:transglutaminase-like putative cysteine protease
MMIHYPAGNKGEPLAAHLESGRFIDSAHPAVRQFAEKAAQGAGSAVEKAVRLFYAVRDGIRYDAFAVRLEPERHIASHVLGGPPAYCIPKAVLLAAAARALGIPSGVGLSNVRNHLTTPKLRERMGGNDLFVDHGYAVLYLEGRWVKAAPAFNIELCERFGVRPTEFDGRSDAVFQEFDRQDRRHMEYVADHGMWSDLPYDRVEADIRANYPPRFFTPADEDF